MKIEITEEEFRKAFFKECGREPSDALVQFALLYNDLRNKQVVDA